MRSSPEQPRTVLSRTAGERARFLLAVPGDTEPSDPVPAVDLSVSAADELRHAYADGDM